jgi:chemotaxis signal transduction protein
MEKTVESKINSGSQMALFEVGNETFGINISSIREIVRVPELTTVPNAPGYLSGLTNLRNKVLPVIDTGKRLNMVKSVITDSSRVLVLDTKYSLSGIIVDKVKGVFNIEDTTIEIPPDIISGGIDRKFIKSVIKSGDDRKIVMEFDVNALCDIDITNEINMTKAQLASAEEKKDESAISAEMQIVTYLISTEEYAFPIQVVNEVLRVGAITKVPNAPDYVSGILTVRNSILPVIDNRKLFGLISLNEELKNTITGLERQTKKWYDEFLNSVQNGIVFKQISEAANTQLGKWLEHFRTVSKEIGEINQDLRNINIKLSNNAKEFTAQSKKLKKEQAIVLFHELITPFYKLINQEFAELSEFIKKGVIEDQRIIVVEINKYPVGLLVDRVQQVLRTPVKALENPPDILTSGRAKALKNIVKFNNGERIILLVDEMHLIEVDKLKQLNDMKNAIYTKEIKTANAATNDEIQLVTFNLDKESYAIAIEDVQEINRIDAITSVPQAPEFIEGVMNLRGNVIPVINLRKRFKLPEKSFDNSTKVIIVTILNRLTGLIVDSVSSVLRVSKRNIETSISIMESNVDLEFLKGVCKTDKTKKMLLLISIEKILTSEQKKQFSSVTSNSKSKDETFSEKEKIEVTETVEQEEIKEENGNHKKLIKAR